jgi:hypothetical protein
MNYTVEITMSYTGLGANPDGTVTKIVRADVSNVKATSNNIGAGRQEDTITGNMIIQNYNDNYDDFATYLNDTSGYFVGPEDWTYKLYINGDQLNTNKIRLTNNDKVNKRLIFKLYDNCINEYTNLFAAWDTERNVVQEVTQTGGTQIEYSDFRELYTIPGYTSKTPLTISSQQAMDTLVDNYIEEEEDKIPYQVDFIYSGSGAAFTPRVYYKTFRAVGYYSDTGIAQPPAGIDWIYDADVSSQPRFKKKPKYRYTDRDSYSLGDKTYTVNIEQEADVNYTGGSNWPLYAGNIQDIIEYLVETADSNITSFDFTGLDDIQGESFNAGGGASTDFMADTWLMPVSSFIPTLAGNKRSNDADKGMISLGVILNFLESLGFIWYLVPSGANYEFVLEHITTRTFGTSNPSLNNYKGKDWSYRVENIEIIEDIYNKVTNSMVGGDYHFIQPEFVFRTGEKTVGLGETRIITDINHVVDGKGSVCDELSGEQWVMFSTTQDGVGNDVIRYITSALNSIATNNYELSFYYLTNNIIEVPAKVDENGTEYNDNRIQKQKKITINAPVDNPQDDFNFYDSVTLGADSTELDQIERGITNSVASIIVKTI